jgi:hypothetical protein
MSYQVLLKNDEKAGDYWTSAGAKGRIAQERGRGKGVLA